MAKVDGCACLTPTTLLLVEAALPPHAWTDWSFLSPQNHSVSVSPLATGWIPPFSSAASQISNSILDPLGFDILSSERC